VVEPARFENGAAVPVPAAGRPFEGRPSVSDLLVGYLLAAPVGGWPGADGMLVSEVLREYPSAAAARLVPCEADLCGRHPELTAEVVAFFFLNGPDAFGHSPPARRGGFPRLPTADEARAEYFVTPCEMSTAGRVGSVAPEEQSHARRDHSG
jgi:hypothetical protein